MTSNANDLTERLRRRLETERQAIEELTDQRWSAHFFPAKPDVGEVLSTAAGGWFESQVGLPVEYEFVLDDSTVARTVALD